MTNFIYRVMHINKEDVLFINSLTTLQGVCLAVEDAVKRGYSVRKEQDVREHYFFGKVGNCFIALDVPDGADIPAEVEGYKGKWATLEDIKEQRILKELEEATWYNGQQNPDWNGLSASNVKCSTIYKLAEEHYGIKLTEGYTKASDKTTMIEEFKSYFSKDGLKHAD